MKIENWKSVPGYKGRYEISNLGRIRSFARSKKPIIKATVDNGTGYQMVLLCMNGRHKLIAVHRIVARVFLGMPPHGKEVNHKSGNKENNSSANLEYMTRSENLYHRYRTLGLKINYGSKNGRHKLTESDVKKIKVLLRRGLTIAKIGKRFGVSDVSISYIRLGRTWRHLLPI